MNLRPNHKVEDKTLEDLKYKVRPNQEINKNKEEKVLKLLLFLQI